MTKKSDAEKLLKKLGAKWADNIDDYASGKIDASQIKCVLCQSAPCKCKPFEERYPEK